jgi:hypothetical protein
MGERGVTLRAVYTLVVVDKSVGAVDNLFRVPQNSKNRPTIRQPQLSDLRSGFCRKTVCAWSMRAAFNSIANLVTIVSLSALRFAARGYSSGNRHKFAYQLGIIPARFTLLDKPGLE